jgi:hypothetical protein
VQMDQKMRKNKGQIRMSWRRADSTQAHTWEFWTLDSQIHRAFWKEMDANLHIHVVSRLDHTALEKVPQSMSQDIDSESTRLDSRYSISEAWLFMGQLCLVQTLRKSCHWLQ